MRASSAVPSREAASISSTSSIAPAERRAQSVRTISPTVSAHSFAGRHTVTLTLRSAAMRSAVKRE